MEGATVVSAQGNGRFRSHLKNAANALCRAGAAAAAAAAAAGGARTLPKQRVSSSKRLAAQHHHTFPKVASQRNSTFSQHQHLGGGGGGGGLVRRDAPVESSTPTVLTEPKPQAKPSLELEDDEEEEPPPPALHPFHIHNGLQKLKGKMAREVASAWSKRVGAPSLPAPAEHVQSLFNDLHLYPTKTQVFEMLVCARQCTRRKSLTLTFGEFCVFAAELRKCANRAKQTSSKPESPYRADPPPPPPREKEGPRVLNGSEASPPPAPPPPPPPPYEVFLGGSCNPTTWRSEIAIPLLEEMGITYFNPQVAEWSLELVEVENHAKQAARALLFVLDSETRAVAASVEAAELAALPRDLLLVLRPYKRGQRIGNEIITDQEYVELSRARATLQEAVERRGLPAFTDIPSALHCARTVLRGARTHPRQPLGHTILRLKRAFDAAGARSARVSRARAVEAVSDLARVPQDAVERCLPPLDSLDFESFCAAVAELTADQGGSETCARSAGPMTGESGAVRGVADRVWRVLRSLRRRMSGMHSPSAVAAAADGSWLNGDSAPNSPVESRCALDFPKEPSNGVHRHNTKDKDKHGYEPTHNSRLKACGKKLSIFIPKSGCASREGVVEGGGCGAGAEASVLTPGTELRLERLPSMLSGTSAPRTSPPYNYDVYLGGSLPVTKSGARPEERLRAEGLTCIVPRVNDYTRMFSTPARRAAPAHPDSPRTDKKPRPAYSPHPSSDEVQLREKENTMEPSDRLSASDFYTVTEDLTPQPFKGTYDEELLLTSRVLLFSISSEAPCLSAMVLAAHYMELRPRAIVLLVQTMERHSPLSETAVKDYNRGRHYLKDLAKRSGVPVFDKAEDALACVIAKVNNTQR